MARKNMAVAVIGTALLVGGVTLGAAHAAADGKIFHWRTADGTYAFTDDSKAIPERYRAQVETRAMGGLDGYERYTPAVSSGPPGQGAAASPATPEATPTGTALAAQRLEYLRALNTPQSQHGSDSGEVQTLIIPTGGSNSPSIEVQARGDDAPVVVETVRVRPKGSLVTRSNLVVRQGDRIITIVKPQRHETNLSSDIADEADLLEQ